jgi:hypothetical protein
MITIARYKACQARLLRLQREADDALRVLGWFGARGFAARAEKPNFGDSFSSGRFELADR